MYIHQVFHMFMHRFPHRFFPFVDFVKTGCQQKAVGTSILKENGGFCLPARYSHQCITFRKCG